MEQADKMIVNAALTALINETTDNWERDAQSVVAICSRLPDAGRVTLSRSVGGQDQSSVAGYAEGVGSVRMDTEGKNEIQEKEVGTLFRIGHYKVAHYPQSRTLVVYHYRQSGAYRDMMEELDADYGSLIPSGYGLDYDECVNPIQFVRAYDQKGGWGRHVVRKTLLYIQKLPFVIRTVLQTGQLPVLYVCMTSGPVAYHVIYPQGDSPEDTE